MFFGGRLSRMVLGSQAVRRLGIQQVGARNLSSLITGWKTVRLGLRTTRRRVADRAPTNSSTRPYLKVCSFIRGRWLDQPAIRHPPCSVILRIVPGAAFRITTLGALSA
jgi:hypothetical protein